LKKIKRRKEDFLRDKSGYIVGDFQKTSPKLAGRATVKELVGGESREGGGKLRPVTMRGIGL